MNHTIKDVLEFVKENDVQFIRLAFCDLLGIQKNISIMPEELPAAFAHGVSFDASAIKGFRSVTQSDLLLFPDPTTLMVLPWRPGPGRVVRFYCDIKNPDGSPFSGDCRRLLKQVIVRSEQMGYTCKIGAECEFYLFRTDEDGNGSDIPLDQGGYLDIAPLDRGENIRREICLCLKEMGIQPETSHHEQGPGQNEIDFRFSDALRCADNLLTFKTVVKAIAARNGLFASFMPKPLAAAPGSGMHINISVHRSGANLFRDMPGEAALEAERFVAGVLKRAAEMTLLLNPLANSYDRFGNFEAPKYVSWSQQNRSQLIRIPAATDERARMELRSPDPSLNPYLGFALILSAGLDGIEQKLQLPPATDLDLFTADAAATQALTALPADMEAAIGLAEDSSFVRQVVGGDLLDKYLAMKKEEAAAVRSAIDRDAFYKNHYFPMI